MTATEHILILLSLVIGLAFAHVLDGVARLIQAKQLRWSGLHATWVLILLWMLTDFWMSVWQLRHEDDWNIWMVLFWVAMTIVMYLASALIVPDHLVDETIDLATFHEENRRRYLGMLIIIALFGLAANLMLAGFATANWWVISQIACTALAAFARPIQLQWAGTIGSVVTFLTYFVVFMSDF